MEVRGENDCGQTDAGRLSCALTAHIFEMFFIATKTQQRYAF